jgi:AbrB family looped-hinge helix DNA binding protein
MSFYRSVMSAKGQLVIPAELRRELGLRAGTGVTLEREGDRLVLVPDSSLDWRSMHGCLKGKPSALEYLQAERKKDREREEKR